MRVQAMPIDIARPLGNPALSVDRSAFRIIAGQSRWIADSGCRGSANPVPRYIFLSNIPRTLVYNRSYANTNAGSGSAVGRSYERL